MKVHLVGGFLGSGKTTAIRNACSALIKKGSRPGVVTNDQGEKLVDGMFFSGLKIPSREVINGCFCCNYYNLEAEIQSLLELERSEIIFAESVGSCTDIVATVMKPLLRFHPIVQVSVSIFADASLLHMFFEEDLSVYGKDVKYIYFKQLEEAGIIVINKIDLICNEDLKNLKQIMREKYPGKILLYQKSLEEDDIIQWLQVLEHNSDLEEPKSLKINYDTYGAGEAKLWWLDGEIEIYSHINNAVQEAAVVIQNIYQSICRKNYAIGHIKFLLDGKSKISFTSTTRSETKIEIGVEKKFAVNLVINARVETDPENLSHILSEVFRKVQILRGCSIIVKSLAAYKPGYPKPTFRIHN